MIRHAGAIALLAFVAQATDAQDKLVERSHQESSLEQADLDKTTRAKSTDSVLSNVECIFKPNTCVDTPPPPAKKNVHHDNDLLPPLPPPGHDQDLPPLPPDNNQLPPLPPPGQHDQDPFIIGGPNKLAARALKGVNRADLDKTTSAKSTDSVLSNVECIFKPNTCVDTPPPPAKKNVHHDNDLLPPLPPPGHDQDLPPLPPDNNQL